MIALATFRTVILPYVHDCPVIVADQAARFTIREFCRKTNWLRATHDPITVLAGIAEYDFEPPDQLQVLEIIDVEFNGRPVTPITVDELNANVPLWRSRTGDPIYVTSIVRDTMILVPTPDTRVNQGLTLTVALEPTVDATQIDETIYQRWSEVIGYGARARLKEMSGQPYYDPAGAAQAMSKFAGGVWEAKAEAQRSLGRAVQHVQMRKW